MIIIDGYNFLRGEGDKLAREKLVSKLSRYQLMRKEKIVIIFDNRVHVDNLRHIKSRNLEVLFANPHCDGLVQTADNRIVRYCVESINKGTSPKTFTIVTTDKPLGDRLKGIGIAKDAIISVQQFKGRMNSQPKAGKAQAAASDKSHVRFSTADNAELLQVFTAQLNTKRST